MMSMTALVDMTPGIKVNLKESPDEGEIIMELRMKRRGIVPTKTELAYMKKYFGVIPIEPIAAELDISAPQFNI